jgi:hypothetical protein
MFEPRRSPRLAKAALVAALTAALSLPAGVGAASAKPSKPAKPDTACMKAGIKTLKEAKLLRVVAKDGISIEDAVALEVAPRESTDLSQVPDPIPFSVLLADHRAGENSLFVYPWC